MVGILGVVSGGYIMEHGAVATCDCHIRRKAEDVLPAVGGVLDICSIIVCSRSVVSERTLVAVAVGFQLTVAAVEIILVPCLGNGHAGGCSLILFVGSIT